MTVSPSEPGTDLHPILDEVSVTGVSLESGSPGGPLPCAPDRPGRSLDRLVPHPGFLTGDSEDVVETDWSPHRRPSRTELHHDPHVVLIRRNLDLATWD